MTKEDLERIKRVLSCPDYAGTEFAYEKGETVTIFDILGLVADLEVAWGNNDFLRLRMKKSFLDEALNEGNGTYKP